MGDRYFRMPPFAFLYLILFMFYERVCITLQPTLVYEEHTFKFKFFVRKKNIIHVLSLWYDWKSLNLVIIIHFSSLNVFKYWRFSICSFLFFSILESNFLNFYLKRVFNFFVSNYF